VSEPSVSIVIPAWNAGSHLPRVVPAALDAIAGTGEVVVVDAGSTDETAEIARKLGARVIRLPERAGPARARNVGVDHVNSDVVFFVDSDCVAHPDTVERIRKAFAEDPRLVGLCGSYDDTPPHQGFASQYMNLRHHYTHHTSPGGSATFWAGCGAVRRSAFLEVGGFDADRFPRLQIEDIELGLRLGKVGIARLDPELQVTHLKAWGLGQVIETDIRNRAVPWARLLLERGELPDNLNLRRSQRVVAALAPLALVAVVAAPMALVARLWAVAALAVGIASTSVALNWGMLRFFAERRGLAFAAAAWAFHQVHLFYSAATFGFCLLADRLERLRS
jgi:glycosyltransferase involved in cell wall biosynthesis